MNKQKKLSLGRAGARARSRGDKVAALQFERLLRRAAEGSCARRAVIGSFDCGRPIGPRGACPARARLLRLEGCPDDSCAPCVGCAG